MSSSFFGYGASFAAGCILTAASFVAIPGFVKESRGLERVRAAVCEATKNGGSVESLNGRRLSYTETFLGLSWNDSMRLVVGPTLAPRNDVSQITGYSGDHAVLGFTITFDPNTRTTLRPTGEDIKCGL